MSLPFAYHSDDIPIGGRLFYFVDNWRVIVRDNLAISLISEGIKLFFLPPPKQSSFRDKPQEKEMLEACDKEVTSLLQKRAISLGDASTPGFYSSICAIKNQADSNQS